MKEKQTPSPNVKKKVKGKVHVHKNALRQSEQKERYFFENYDFSSSKVLLVGKWVLFALLIVIETLIAIQIGLKLDQSQNIPIFILVILMEIAIAIAELLKMFILNGGGSALGWYSFQLVIVFLLTALTGHQYLIYLNILILTGFYIISKNAFWSTLVFVLSVTVYMATTGLSSYLVAGSIDWIDLLTRSFGMFIAHTLHFVVVNFAVGFYKQYLRLQGAMKALEKSNQALEQVYAERSEIALLEERQRIAKDIHDTAGHSITTVIMQTEAAKLIFDKNPKEAKNKLISANLQAKHALEELRESVHLLSGVSSKATLKSALQRIINDTTDGTDIVIRSKIDDVKVSDSKYRFLTNTLKEGLSNGLRHGNATAFYFELKTEEKKIKFLLSDNGEGIDINQMKEGMGLSGMIEHAERLGGKIQFLSDRDEGFEIQLTLPMDANKTEKE